MKIWKKWLLLPIFSKPNVKKIIIINKSVHKENSFSLSFFWSESPFIFLFLGAYKCRLPWKWMNFVEFPDSEDKQSSEFLFPPPPHPHPVNNLRPQSGPPSAPCVYRGGLGAGKACDTRVRQRGRRGRGEKEGASGGGLLQEWTPAASGERMSHACPHTQNAHSGARRENC